MPNHVVFQPQRSLTVSVLPWLSTLVKINTLCRRHFLFVTSTFRRHSNHLGWKQQKTEGMKNEGAAVAYFSKRPSRFPHSLLSSHTSAALSGAS